MNVVCYERVNNEQVCYEQGLSRMWPVKNVVCCDCTLLCYERVWNECGVIWNALLGVQSVVNMVCYERGVLWTWSVMKGCLLWRVVCYEQNWYECALWWIWSAMNVVWYERGYVMKGGMLWTWSVMNWSVTNIACYAHGLTWKLSVMNALCNERAL